MVKSVVNGVATYYPGGHYHKEVDGANVTTRKYYAAAGMRLAVRTKVNAESDTLNWQLSDHLGSTSMAADASGEVISEIRYTAFGETRYENGVTPTDYRYTGQREEAELGLYYYVARWYDPALGRFTQADTIVPDPGSAKAYDRYAYVSNNPMKYVDPSGHGPCEGALAGCKVEPWPEDEDGDGDGDGGGDGTTPTTPRLINSCGVGGGDRCGEGEATGNELVLSALRDKALELGYNVYYTDYEEADSLKTTQAERIVKYMDPHATFDICLAGHSAAADSLLIALSLFLEQGGDPSRIKGIAILDSTLTAKGKDMINLGNEMVEVFAEVIYGYQSTDPNYELPEALVRLPGHYQYFSSYGHIDLANPGRALHKVMIDFGWIKPDE